MSKNDKSFVNVAKGSESPWCTSRNEIVKSLAYREERELLSILLQEKICISEIINSGIKYDYFWWIDHSVIFKFIAKNFDSYKTILTREQFRNEIERTYKETEEQTYYRNLYDEIINLNISPEDFPSLKSHVVFRYSLLKATDIIFNHSDKILSSNGKDSSVVESFIQDAVSIRSNTDNEYSKTVAFSDSLGEV